MSNPILAWHFLTKDLIPGVGRRRKPLYVGHLWREKGPPVLCKHGLHASERILDALGYAYSPVVCRVSISGTVVHGDDKLVGTRRKILAMGDIEILLHEWACDVAEEVCRRAEVLDERFLEAIEVKRRWLRGESTYEELDAAGDTAWDAARAAAGDTAWAAAWAAAGAAAGDTAWDAARAALNADLEERVLQAIGMEEIQP